MISDNFVIGDNVYLNELRNFFFEVLGMMSITHYGAIGDGRTDNYAYLQVAIDDANRRGLQYIYVPYGRYIYTGELQNLGTITFMGNPKAKIINIRTGEEIPVIQFALGNNSFFKTEYTYMLTRGRYIDLSGNIGSKVDITPIPSENTAYYIAPVKVGEKYEVVGVGTLAKLSEEFEIQFKYDFTSSDPGDTYFFTPTSDGIFVVSFMDTSEIEPHIWHTYDLESMGIQPLLTAGDGIEINGTVISATGASARVTTLTENVVLAENVPLTLQSGFYMFESPYGLYYHEALGQNLIYGYNDGIFYFDNQNQTVYLDEKTWFYELGLPAGDWYVMEHTNITNEIVNDRGKIPTSQAVFNAFNSIGGIGAGGTEDFIVCSLQAASVEIQDGTAVVPLTTYNSNGSKFTVANNEITVGAGVSKIRVSAQAEFWLASSSEKKQRSIDIGIGSNPAATASTHLFAIEHHEVDESYAKMLYVAPIIVDVSEGDKICFYVNSGATGDEVVGNATSRFPKTFISVEDVSSLGNGCAATAYLSVDTEISAGTYLDPYTELSLTSSNVAGDGLSISNGKIVVGVGVKNVLVSGSSLIVPGTSTTGSALAIYKNDTIVATAEAQPRESLHITDKLISVQYGDTISLRAKSFGDGAIVAGETANKSLTYLTVKTVSGGTSDGTSESGSARKLTDHIAFTDGTPPSLEEGFYYTANKNVTANGVTIFGTNEILYYDADRQELAGAFKTISYSNNAYFTSQNMAIETSVSQSNYKIPTSGAVYNAINN